MELLLAVLAFILAMAEEFQKQGRSLLGWAVVCLALIVLLPAVKS